MGIKLITAPTDEPVTIEEAKLHLHETGTDQDDLIGALIESARARVEEDIQRALIMQTWELTRDAFDAPSLVATASTSPTSMQPTPTVITLPYSPVSALKRISYVDAAGVTQLLHDEIGSPTLTGNVLLDSHSIPARIAPAAGGSWPATASQINAVTIRYTAGYGANGDAVPAPIRQAILMLLAHWYENREAINIGNISTELPLAAQWLLEPYRLLVTA